MELGRVGAWWPRTVWTDEAAATRPADLAGELEQLGFSGLWLSAGFGAQLPDWFAACLGATSSMVVASGIASVWHLSAPDATSAFHDLEERFPGRFVLGLGASHAPIVEAGGGQYERPLSRLSGYLDELDAQPDPIPADRRILAALGPRMLSLAGRRTAGAHPYFVPVEHTVQARSTLGPLPLLVTEQAAVLETDPSRAREIARTYTAYYLRLPNYTSNLRRLGFGDDDLAGAGSDRLVDALVAWGDEEAIATRVGEHLAAGANHICLQVLPADPQAEPLPAEAYRRVAPAVAAL